MMKLMVRLTCWTRKVRTMESRNLVLELEKEIGDVSHVAWVGSFDGSLAMSWEDFAMKFIGETYTPDVARDELPYDLVVVLDDESWYERVPWSVGWIHRYPPKKRWNAKPFTYVTIFGSPYVACQYESLQDLNTKSEVG